MYDRDFMQYAIKDKDNKNVVYTNFHENWTIFKISDRHMWYTILNFQNLTADS